MVTFVDKNGREVKVSIFDAVFSPGRTIRTKKRAAKPKANAAKVEAAAPVAEAGPAEPAPTPAPEAPTEPTPAEPTATEAATQTPDEITTEAPATATIETPAEAAAATAEVATESKVEEAAAVTTEEEAATTPAAEPSAEWTEKDDKLLMEMKGNNNTWKQINAALPGKTHTKEHYKTLSKGKGKETAEVKDNEPVQVRGKENAGGNGNGKETAAAEGSGKGKGKQASSRRLPNYVDHEAILKTDEFDNDEYDGPRPVIVKENGAPLTARETRFLFQLHEYFEGIKWLMITSRFGDKANGDLDPKKLRRILGDRQWSDRTFNITAKNLVGREPPEQMVPKY
ncbi:hypothetical protein MMC30_006575 [Trapelia coarctata]|nr:hypothetical protein [Trapelia coarctata]